MSDYIEKRVYENLVRFYNNIEGTYDIEESIEYFPYCISLGYSYQDRLNIFKMLYLNNCSLDDLKNMTLEELMEYIEETDERFLDDVKYFNRCVELIKMCEN